MNKRNGIASLTVGALLMIAPPADAQIDRAEVTGGKVSGEVAHGIASFKGIPFALPPTGHNRWRSPQPVAPWTGVKSATAFAPACMQDTSFAAALGAPRAVSEDCLYLNVWTPAKTPRERLPVMVWIYGGAFVLGGTNWPLYDGTHLAEKGVVLVSVAYRVGPFGFLAHPRLSQESGHGSGNYGLEDQIAGLKWVRDNVARFGGDPHRVTVFGESAGGIAVSMLAASPQAKGLYQRAISESGGSLAPPHAGAGQGVQTLQFAEKTGDAFLAALGVHDINAARGLPAEKILAGARRAGGGGFWPTLDGYVIVGDEYELYQAGRFNDTPVLIGTNSDEGAMFTGPRVTPADYEKQIRGAYGEQADLILAANPHATDVEAHTAAKNNFRDSVFAWSTWRWASLQSQRKGTGKAYLYYFDHRAAASPDGASHGTEIPFVFGNPVAGAPPPTEAEKALSELMSSYWVNFAKNGDPNGRGLPPWPAFSDANPQVMHFDDNSSARPGVPNLEQLQALDTYFAWRRSQESKTSP